MKIPKKIYLQWFGDGEPEPNADVHEVTWCEDNIFDQDIEYVMSAKSKRRLSKVLKCEK